MHGVAQLLFNRCLTASVIMRDIPGFPGIIQGQGIVGGSRFQSVFRRCGLDLGHASEEPSVHDDFSPAFDLDPLAGDNGAVSDKRRANVEERHHDNGEDKTQLAPIQRFFSGTLAKQFLLALLPAGRPFPRIA